MAPVLDFRSLHCLNLSLSFLNCVFINVWWSKFLVPSLTGEYIDSGTLGVKGPCETILDEGLCIPKYLSGEHILFTHLCLFASLCCIDCSTTPSRSVRIHIMFLLYREFFRHSGTIYPTVQTRVSHFQARQFSFILGFCKLRHL